MYEKSSNGLSPRRAYVKWVFVFSSIGSVRFVVVRKDGSPSADMGLISRASLGEGSSQIQEVLIDCLFLV